MRHAQRWIVLVVALGGLASLWVALAPATDLPVLRPNVTAMVTRALASVVSIASRRITQGDFNKRTPSAAIGADVLVDAHGSILTNEHVIRGAAVIKVTLTDGRSFQGAVVGADRFTDLALVKIEGTGLRALPLGNASKLRIGDPVVAIGSPLWIEGGPTVTTGVISGKGRSMEEPDDPEQAMLHDLLQTDAAINPGNSGGPLLNLAGQVVGVNTAIMESAHGIGFALSIDNAKPVMTTLLRDGRFVRPFLGVTAVSVTPQLAFTNDLKVDRGALVVRVDRSGPAAAVGLRPDDVIIAVGSEIVQDFHHFHDLLFRHKPGDTMQVTVWRDGETLTVSPGLVQDRWGDA